MADLNSAQYSAAQSDVRINVGGERTKEYAGYNKKVARYIGIARIVVAGLTIVVQITAIGLINSSKTSGYFPKSPGWGNNVAVGIWGGALVIVGGCFGVISSVKATKCPIYTNLVLAIVAASLVPVLLLTFSALALEDMTSLQQQCPGHNEYCKFYPTSCYSKEMCSRIAGVIAMDSLLIPLAITIAVLEIVSAVLCCKAIVCRTNTPQGPPPFQLPTETHRQNIGATSITRGPDQLTSISARVPSNSAGSYNQQRSNEEYCRLEPTFTQDNARNMSKTQVPVHRPPSYSTYDNRTHFS